MEKRKKVLVLLSGKPGACSEGTPHPPPLRQHKNVRFRKSVVKLEEKSYVRTRPEKSSGGEGLRPPPEECSKHRALTKVRSADFQHEVESKHLPERSHGAKYSPPGHQVAPDWLRGGDPPVCIPDPPLIHDISGSNQ